MAKMNGGLFSKLSGKLAGVVFQQYEGLNVSKEYQPNVKNPSTAGQVQNRARFKGASQMVAVFADVFLIAAANVSPYVRMVRGALVKALRSAFTWNSGTNTAEITTDAMATAVNSLHFNPTIPAPVITGNDIGHAEITATDGDTVEYTVVALNSDGDILGTTNQKFVSSGGSTQIIVPATQETPDNYTIAAVATRVNTSEGAASYGNLGNLETIAVLYGVNAGDILASHVATANIPQSA